LTISDVVRALLTVDPRQRMNVEQLLRHPWVCGERQRAASSLPGFGESLHSLRAFKERRAARAGGGCGADDSESSAVAPAIRAGALAKEGYWSTRWRARWFVLTADRLDYYKKPSDEDPSGGILLKDIAHIKACGVIRSTPPDCAPTVKEDGAGGASTAGVDGREVLEVSACEKARLCPSVALSCLRRSFATHAHVSPVGVVSLVRLVSASLVLRDTRTPTPP
jgi:hypothetical protein